MKGTNAWLVVFSFLRAFPAMKKPVFGCCRVVAVAQSAPFFGGGNYLQLRIT